MHCVSLCTIGALEGSNLFLAPTRTWLFQPQISGRLCVRRELELSYGLEKLQSTEVVDDCFLVAFQRHLMTKLYATVKRLIALNGLQCIKILSLIQRAMLANVSNWGSHTVYSP